jgi:asparagine synthetase B (glutamine-hydrolysing)
LSRIERVSMLCLNNFVIIGVYEDIPSLVYKISKLTGLKVQEVILTSAKIIVATKKECMLEKDNYILLLYGVFPNENASLIDKAINDLPIFIKNYSYQGVAVLFDPKNASIVVVGDPGPARTVFYLSEDEVFIISTDMNLVKAVANILGIDLRQDILTLFELIVLGSKISRRTAYKNIRRLLPGEYINIKIKNGKKHSFEITVEKYWDGIQSEMNNEINPVIFFTKTIHEQLTAFCKETRKPPIAVPVSGGLDSTYLLFIAKQAGCNQIIAPHLNLGSKQEEILSKYVATKANVPYLHFSLPYIDPDNYIQQLTKLFKLIGYPRQGDGALPYLLLAQKLKGVKFSLGGEASDPVFGGDDFYKYFAVQLIKQKRFKELWNLIKILKKYNYHNENIVAIIFKIINQVLLSFYPIRYWYFLSITHRRMRIKNNALKKIISQYLTELTRPFYEAPTQNYYPQIISNILRYETSHIAHTRIKSDESQGIFTFLPFATRKVLEASMSIPVELFFFPWGSRSILRLFLKYMGLPPAVYLQRKSGFSLTSNVLRDINILTYMKETVLKCWASRYVKIDKLTPYQIHNLFNLCVDLDSISEEK